MKGISLLDTVKLAASAPSPRVIKSHLPFEFLPPNLLDTCKVIFVGRRPKDCCVSFFHHFQNDASVLNHRMKADIDFNDFAQLFLKGAVMYGNYWTMLKSAWKQKDHPNLKILWFEEMKNDMMVVIRDVANFIGYPMTEYKVLQLDDHLHIDNFRKVMVESVADEEKKVYMKKFIRKGQVGEGENYFDEETNKVWNEWIDINWKGTGIRFPEIV